MDVTNGHRWEGLRRDDDAGRLMMLLLNGCKSKICVRLKLIKEWGKF